MYLIVVSVVVLVIVMIIVVLKARRENNEIRKLERELNETRTKAKEEMANIRFGK